MAVGPVAPSLWQLAGRLLGGVQSEDLLGGVVCIPWCSLSAADVLPLWADACVHVCVCVPVQCILCLASILKIVLYRDAVEWESRVGRGRQPCSQHWVFSGLQRATEHLPQPRPLPWAQHERAFKELSENFLLFYKNAKINKLIGNKP